MFNPATLLAGLMLTAVTGEISGKRTLAGTTNFAVEITTAGPTATTVLLIATSQRGSATAKRDSGPNLPLGLTEVFVFDVTSTSQAEINPKVIRERMTALWRSPEQSPDRGMSLNNVDGNDLYARFAWAAGDGRRIAGNEVELDGSYSEYYVRITWRMNRGWDWCTRSGKHFFFQNSPYVSSQNTAPGPMQGGRAPGGGGVIGVLNTSPTWPVGTTQGTLGEWIDDEWWFSSIPGPSELKAWRNGVLEIDLSGVGTGSAHTNMLNLGPWTGGDCTKTQNGDYWDIKRLVVWAR